MTTDPPILTPSPGTTRIDPAPPPRCEFSALDFTATASTACGVRIIRVAGSGVCPTAGWRLALVTANPGVVPHPRSLWLQMRETPPTHAPTRVLVDVDVETIIEDSWAVEVVIRFTDGDPITVPVVEAAQVGRATAPGRWAARRR